MPVPATPEASEAAGSVAGYHRNRRALSALLVLSVPPLLPELLLAHNSFGGGLHPRLDLVADFLVVGASLGGGLATAGLVLNARANTRRRRTIATAIALTAGLFGLVASFIVPVPYSASHLQAGVPTAPGLMVVLYSWLIYGGGMAALVLAVATLNTRRPAVF